MSALKDLRALLGRRVIQWIALAVMLVWVAQGAVDHKFSVRDNDIWWHLKTGDWIVEHFAVPHNGLFSWTAASRPWVAYSWGFEVMLSRAYAWFNLMGLGLFGVLLTLLIAYLQFWSLRRLSGRFWEAWLLAACSLYTFLFVIGPRPVFVSIIFYIVLLTVLLEVNRGGPIRNLYWLPVMFLVWANIHIQFVYGLFVFGLFVAFQLASRWVEKNKIATALSRSPSLPPAPLVLTLGACVAATLIGPYSYHLYQVIFLYSKAKYSYQIIVELQPLTFRLSNQFVELLLTAAGFCALGWRKRIDLFKFSLLIVASFLAFRTLRDCWFVSITAAAFIADFPASDSERDRGETLPEGGLLLATLAIFLVLLSQNFDFNERSLDRYTSLEFPVDAVNYLRKHPLAGPLYNNLDWGGFLTWYMPQFPVAIDGRNDLYGDDLDKTFFEAQSALAYKNDPYLLQSGFVLLSKKYPLATVLRLDPRFQLMYEDKIAVVFARR
ncbi:MAG: hypothetical protein WAK13_08740 [Terriglobales bacterium]